MDALCRMSAVVLILSVPAVAWGQAASSAAPATSAVSVSEEVQAITDAIREASVSEEVRTFAAMIRDRAVLRRALQEPVLRDTKWFKALYEGGLEKAERALLARVQIRPVPGTRLVEVSFEGGERADVAPIVNSVVKVCLQWIQEELQRDCRRVLTTLGKDADKLKSAMRLYKKELHELAEDFGGMGIEQMRTRLALAGQRIVDLTARMTKAEVCATSAGQARAALEKAIQTGRVDLTVAESAAIQADAILTRLEFSKMEVDGKLKKMRKSLSSDDPQIKQLEGRRAELLRQQAKRRNDLTTQAVANRLQDLRSTYQEASKKLREYSDELENTKVRQKLLAREVSEYAAAEGNYREVQTLYEEVSGQRRRAELALMAPVPVVRVGQALPPLKAAANDTWRASARIWVRTLKPPDPMGP